jgi:hypothetical protein
MFEQKYYNVGALTSYTEMKSIQGGRKGRRECCLETGDLYREWEGEGRGEGKGREGKREQKVVPAFHIFLFGPLLLQ